MDFASRRTRPVTLILAAVAALAFGTPVVAQLNVLTVDCNPFVSPNPATSFGPDNTMGMSLQQVDPANVLFNVTEVTPPAFRALTAAQLAAYDVIAVNNNPTQLSDGCVLGAGTGLGTTWHSVIGINSGGRVFLTSHDAARFKIIVPPGATPFGFPAGPCVNCEPFASDDLVKQAVLWAGGGTQTGLVIFNDSARFGSVGGVGWDNAELNLPAAWNITDSDQSFGGFMDGGYTDILAAFAAHPIYAGINDQRLQPNSLSSFGANIGDTSFHSIFQTFEASIFTPTEQLINAGILDVGGFNAAFGVGAFAAPVGPDGLAISLIRNEQAAVPSVTQRGRIILGALLLVALTIGIAIFSRYRLTGSA